MIENFVEKEKILERISYEKMCSEKIVAYKGVERPLWDWANELDVTATRLNKKIAKALSPEEAIDAVAKEKRRYYYGGKFYNRAGLAKLCECSPTELSRRLSSGMSPEEAVEIGRYRKKPQTFTMMHEGAETTHTIAEWRNIFSVDKTTYDQRINSGWGIERALKTPVKKKKHSAGKGKKIRMHGEERTINDWCNLLGVNRATYYDRKKKGMTDAEALKTPIQKYEFGKEIDYGSRRGDERITLTYMDITRNLQQWAEITGFKYIVLQERYKSDKSAEEILTTPLHQRTTQNQEDL